MSTGNENLRDRLLAQHVAEPDKLARYRKEMEVMLERNEKVLQREKWYASTIWLVVVTTSVPFLVYGGYHADEPRSAFWAAAACVWFLFGGIELIKHFINRTRVEQLKELKRIELEVLELREALQGRTAG